MLKKWLMSFWKLHGERFVFAFFANLMAATFIVFGTDEVVGAGWSIVIGTAMIFFNKIRSPKNGDYGHEPEKPVGGLSPDPRNGEKGSAATVLLIAMLAVAAITWFTMVQGCATASQKPIVYQIMDQTSDIGTIALASFADAQEAYINAQELYLPYQAAIRAARPDLDSRILGYFTRANAFLDGWEAQGAIPQNDQVLFRLYIRQALLEMAQALDERTNK